MIIKMKRILLILLLLTSLGAQAQVNTYIITQTGQAEFDTSRVFKMDSLTTYVTPSQLSDSIATVTGGSSDSVTFATQYRLDSTRTGLDSRIALKVNTADSATAYVTPKRLADTATVLRGLIPTVPTIYYQMIKRNGTPYTQQPTLDFSTQFALNDNIGTSATDVSVSALAQSVVTGLTDSLNSRVRYVDTSGMLTPYLRKVDTSTLSSRINLKLNIADTTTMLTPYLRDVDTSTLSSRINLKADLASPALTGNVTITNTADITLGAESALRVGGAANSTNITMGEYNSVLGIQARNNGTSANLFLQGDGGGVSVGNGALTGQRIFAVNNTGAGTGDYASIEVRNGSAGTDALRLWCPGTGFTTSGSTVQDAAVVTAGTGLSGGMSLGALANAPVRLYSNNANWFTLLANGNFVGVSTGALGYGTGAGGTVTQATSKATGVTLNKLSGEITLNNAVLNAGTIVSFTLTNSTLTATDVLVLNHVATGTLGAYTLNAKCNAGTATISVRNNTAGNLTEAIVIRFATIKGSTN